MGRKQDSHDIQNIYQSAIAIHQQGELTRAINLYYQVLETFPEAAEVFYNLGLAWFELKQFPEAVEAYKRASELNSQDSDIFYNLGLAYKMDKQFDAAEQAYLTALELSEDLEDILYNLGCCYQDSGAIEQACLVFERLLEIHPAHLPALNNYAYLQHLQENLDTARDLYKRILQLDPNRPSAKHMYATLSGESNEAPPLEYVRELFDQYSEHFDENLVNDLEYNTFCILRQAVEGLSEDTKQFEHGLDLGCGTGLSGEAFHSACKQLTGVDLSEKMLRQAAEKNLYNELYCGDIIEFLEQNGHRFDLIVAADVLPYLGNLESLFSAAMKRTTDNGLFCLSSEGTAESGWKLQVTGRYAHNPDYIALTAEKTGWLLLERFPANIRKENDTWIKGSIFVLGKKTVGKQAHKNTSP